jgi:hypothetical protein
MGLFDGIGSALLGGVIGGQTAQETNKAQLASTAANITAQRENQERGLDALQGSTAFGDISRTPSGGFQTTQPGAADAAKARSTLSSGDRARAARLNQVGQDFDFAMPTLADAQGVVDRDNALQMGQFQKGLDDLITSRQRTSGGIQLPGSRFEGETVDAIGRFADANRLGGETEALDLFNKSREADLALLGQQLNVNQPQVPLPAYTTGTPGGTAANVIAQSPPKSTVPDIASAIPFQAVGGIVSQLQAQEQRREDNKNFLEALRVLGNQKAGVTI